MEAKSMISTTTRQGRGVLGGPPPRRGLADAPAQVLLDVRVDDVELRAPVEPFVRDVDGQVRAEAPRPQLVPRHAPRRQSGDDGLRAARGELLDGRRAPHGRRAAVALDADDEVRPLREDPRDGVEDARGAVGHVGAAGGELDRVGDAELLDVAAVDGSELQEAHLFLQSRRVRSQTCGSQER